MTQRDMHGTVCLVTGSSSGLGKATALGLAKLGATVILGCRDKERGESALAEIKAASGQEALELLLIDLSVQQSVREMAAEFKQKYPRLDVTALAIHPGLVKSKLMREAAAPIRWITSLLSTSPEKAAKAVVHYASSPDVAGLSGRFVKGRKIIEASPYAQDQAVQKRLWEVSMTLTHLA